MKIERFHASKHGKGANAAEGPPGRMGKRNAKFDGAN